MATRIYLRKNDLTENPERPYFTLVLPPEQEDGEWVEIGALWKAKSGNGYTGNLKEGVEVNLTAAFKKFVPGAKEHKDAQQD
jgi:hypothetical protein